MPYHSKLSANSGGGGTVEEGPLLGARSIWVGGKRNRRAVIPGRGAIQTEVHVCGKCDILVRERRETNTSMKREREGEEESCE